MLHICTRTNVPITQSLLHEWEASLWRVNSHQKKSRRRAYTLGHRPCSLPFLFPSSSPPTSPTSPTSSADIMTYDKMSKSAKRQYS